VHGVSKHVTYTTPGVRGMQTIAGKKTDGTDAHSQRGFAGSGEGT
jgi:hypothetical protein